MDRGSFDGEIQGKSVKSGLKGEGSLGWPFIRGSAVSFQPDCVHPDGRGVFAGQRKIACVRGKVGAHNSGNPNFEIKEESLILICYHGNWKISSVFVVKMSEAKQRNSNTKYRVGARTF